MGKPKTEKKKVIEKDPSLSKSNNLKGKLSEKKSQSKKQITSKDVETVSEIIENNTVKLIEPDFHYKLKLYIANKKGLRKLNKPYIKILLTMSRIPIKYIKVQVEDDSFFVDTSEYTKKYHIERKFPEGVKVQSEADPVVKYDGNTLAIICLLQTPVAKEVDNKFFEIAKSVHESYKIKLGPSVQPKKKLVQNIETQIKKEDKKRKRKEAEQEFQEKQKEKGEREKLKREKKRRRIEKKQQQNE